MDQPENNSDHLILSLDGGTQSIRAALVDLQGNIRTLVRTPVEPYFATQPGRAELDPEVYYEALCTSCKQLIAETTEPIKNIVGVAVTTQRMTFVNVDKEGKVLRPAIVWLDQRKADASKIIPTTMVPILKLLRLHEFVCYAVGYARSNWIQQQEPEIWEQTHKFLTLCGYLTYRLSGEFIDSTGNIMGTLPFDAKAQIWARRFDPKWLLFPMDRDKLPDLVAPSEQIGTITQKATKETGIPAQLPLIASSNDKSCELLGVGCLSPEEACISFGTTATINTQTKRYVELQTLMPPYPSAIPGTYCTEVSVMRGFWMVSWFKQEFGTQESLAATEQGIAPEELLEQLIRDVPPGSKGLVLQPYWTPGPDLETHAKGSVIGFGDVHTRAHLYRAIIEGIVFALREGAELTQKKNKIPLIAVRASGGGSRSDSVMQITADILNLPVLRPHTSETSALGAALNVAVGLKYYPTYAEAVDKMCRVSERFEPNPINRQLYDGLYHGVYKKMYDQLSPLFKEIQKVTGYPESAK